VNLHVFSAGCSEIDRMLAFGNWLRANRDDRDLYASTKRASAQQELNDPEDYAAAKTAVVADIMSRAVRGPAT